LRKSRKLKGLSRHHKECRSRGGKDNPENIVYLPQSFHDAWHKCFLNLSLNEAFILMQLIYQKSYVNDRIIQQLQRDVKRGKYLIREEMVVLRTKSSPLFSNMV